MPQLLEVELAIGRFERFSANLAYLFLLTDTFSNLQCVVQYFCVIGYRTKLAKQTKFSFKAYLGTVVQSRRRIK